MLSSRKQWASATGCWSNTQIGVQARGIGSLIVIRQSRNGILGNRKDYD